MSRFLWLILAFYCFLAGCATKDLSTSFHIIISTNPPEAELTVCNQTTKLCVSSLKTPSKMILYRSPDVSWPQNYTVLCKKKGFVAVERTLKFGADGWYLLIVDEATSETVEVRDVDGYKIELDLPISETVEVLPGDDLAILERARH